MGGRERLKADLAKHRRVGLDSSILIYHLEGLSPYAELTEVVVTGLARGDLTAVISTISVTELLAKPFAQGEEERVRVCEGFLRGLPNAVLVPLSFEIAKEAARLRGVHRLRTPDALIIATALREEASAFLTNDQKLKNLDGKGIAILILDDYLD